MTQSEFRTAVPRLTFPKFENMPLEYRLDSSGGWHIYAGYSKFLVAEGSNFSAPIGRALIKVLAQPPYRSIRHIPKYTAERHRG